MRGVICTRDILCHPLVTVHCFGWRTLWKVVFARQEQTFLALLEEDDFLHALDADAGSALERCVALELRAKQIYESWAERFAENPAAARFFATLARQEQDHADLLRLSAAAARRCREKSGLFTPWRNCFPRLERQMRDAEFAAATVRTIDNALRLVVEVESSEINQVFRMTMAFSRSPFVQRLRPFQEAIETHLGYIADEVPRIAPKLAALSQKLRGDRPAHGQQVSYTSA